MVSQLPSIDMEQEVLSMSMESILLIVEEAELAAELLVAVEEAIDIDIDEDMVEVWKIGKEGGEECCSDFFDLERLREESVAKPSAISTRLMASKSERSCYFCNMQLEKVRRFLCFLRLSLGDNPPALHFCSFQFGEKAR